MQNLTCSSAATVHIYICVYIYEPDIVKNIRIVNRPKRDDVVYV